MDVRIETFILGPLETNTYLVICDGECWVVDPAMYPAGLLERLRRDNLCPSRILITHGHADHIAGTSQLREAFPEVRICCPEADAFMLTNAQANLSAIMATPIVVPPADEPLSAGQELSCGRSRWLVIDTSGHSPGGVSFYCRVANAVMTGDSLLAGGIGRVDLPGGGAARLLRNIRRNLLTLPPATRVLPGHGEPTDIQTESRTNPFFADK